MQTSRYYRKTIKNPIKLEGKGIHSGERVHLNLLPAECGQGLVFRSIQKDSTLGSRIEVSPENVKGTVHAVTLSNGDWQIQTVEHVLAALATAGVTDLTMEVDSQEVPIMDGSAQPFYMGLMSAGIHEYAEEIEPIKIHTPVWVVEDNKYLVALPHAGLRITYNIDFPHPELRGQSISLDIDESTLAEQILPARTFGFLKEVEAMKARGLIKGASEENAVVLTETGYLNDLRYPEECVRHKVLDLIGDLYLLGRPLQGHFIASRAGHALDVALGRNILAQQRADELSNRRLGRNTTLIKENSAN